MTLLNTVNVGGTDFGLLNNAVIGTCATPAGSEVKACTFTDNFELKAGVVVAVAFTYANTYGDGSTTYPKLSVNGASYPIKYATNAYAGAGAWINGQTVPFMFNGDSFILVANLMQTSVISASSTVVNGAPLYNGASVKVMFTSALTGADASTALVLNYNGSNIAVKVPVNGALVDYTAKAVDESGTTAYYYCQAYTTLELMFDGTQFIIMENPAVISTSDYTIYADGSTKYNSSATQINLGINMAEVHSGGANRYYKIGYVNISNAQAFTVLQIIGGRIDSFRGIRYLSLSTRDTIKGKYIFPSYNNSIHVYKIDDKLYVYARLETYVYLQFFAFEYITQKFHFEIEEVSSLPSNPIFDNNFTEM